MSATTDAIATRNRKHHVLTVLAAVEAMIERRASKDQMEYTIGNRSIKRMSLPDLLLFRSEYRAELASIEAAERLAAGLPDKRRMYIRFGPAGFPPNGWPNG